MHRITAVLVCAVVGFCIDARMPASEIQLPPIGTNINYDYALGAPAIHVAQNVPPVDVWQRDLTFADGQYLFVQFENVPPTPHAMQIDLYLRGAALRDMFEPLFISFDEQLSFVIDGGTTINIPKNSGIGYSSDDPDTYSFSWSIEPPDHDFAIYGLRWSISPDLVGSAVPTNALDVQIGIFANGAIWVVPEPTTVAMLAVVVLFCSRRRWCESRSSTAIVGAKAV